MAHASEKTILVVDDEPDVRNFLAACLEDAGFNVETAVDGLDALEKVETVKPDIMTLAKSLGSGVPVGAIVASSKVCDVLGPGSHATTFGGSPLVCSAAIATFEAIESGRLLNHVNKISKFLFIQLENLRKKYPSIITTIKGLGVMFGVELAVEGDEIVSECRQEGLLINCTQKNILRIMPPIIVKKGEVKKAIKVLDDILAKAHTI